MLDARRRVKAMCVPYFNQPNARNSEGSLDNNIIPRGKNSLNWLVMKKTDAGVLYMMLETGMEVAQDYTVFKYGPPSP